MDWAAPSQEFFLKKVRQEALDEGAPLSERDLAVLCHGAMGFYESKTPPEPGFRKRIVKLLHGAYNKDLRAHEASDQPWKHYGHPKLVWLKNLRNWYPAPVNELRAAVEQWALERFGELKFQDHELFGGM